MHRFDAILRDPHGASAPWDRALDESRSFVAFPSLGSLVEGWMLIVPRRPMLNLSALDDEEWAELDQFQTQVARRLSAFGTQIFLFEHGNRMAGGALGCGVDQAHLHIVPLPFDLVAAAVASSDDDIRWKMRTAVTSFRAAVTRDNEYVSIVNLGTGTGATGNVVHPKSQWVRRVIAQRMGIPDEWNYNHHPNTSNLLATVSGYNVA